MATVREALTHALDTFKYKRWLNLCEMLYLVVISRVPMKSPLKLGDDGTSRTYVTCVVAEGDYFEAYEVITGRRIQFNTDPRGFTVGHKTHCHLVSIDGIPRDSIPKGLMLPSLMSDAELTEFKALSEEIDDVVDRLNKAAPWYNETGEDKEAWHYNLNKVFWRETEEDSSGGPTYKDPENPWAMTIEDEILPDKYRKDHHLWVRPWDRDDVLPGHLPKSIPLNFFITDKKGKTRKIGYAYVNQCVHARDRKYVTDWLRTRVRDRLYDGAKKTKVFKNPSFPYSKCSRCKEVTRHTRQPDYIRCTRCSSVLHTHMYELRFLQDRKDDPLPFEKRPVWRKISGRWVDQSVLARIKEAWTLNDASWFVTIPFYHDVYSRKAK